MTCESIFHSGDDTTNDPISKSPKILFQPLNQQIQAQSRSQMQSSFTIETEVPKEEVNTAQKVLRTMSQATAKIVPSSDIYSKKKRKSDDELTEAYLKQSEGLNNLALQVSQTLLAKNNPESAYTIASDPIIEAIHLALTKVKDADKFQCMLDVLQYINEKYIKNNN